MSVELYKKKPVVVEAMHLKSPDSLRMAIRWIEQNGGRARMCLDGSGILVTTMEGDMRARRGWYIIRGIKGEFYPCEAEIFLGTYEKLVNL